MGQRQDAIVNALETSRRTLNETLSRVTDWNLPVQDEDQKWTVRQMLSHLVDAQRGMTGQMKRINDGQESVPADFDLNRWNKRSVEKMAERTPDDLKQQLAQDHGTLKEFVNRLSDADLDKRGRHSSLVIMSIEEIGLLIASHEREHTMQILGKIGETHP